MSKSMKDLFAGLLFFIIGILILILLPSQIKGGGDYGLEVGPAYVPKGMAIAMVIFSSLLLLKTALNKSFREDLKDFTPTIPAFEVLGVLVLIVVWVFGLFHLPYLVVTIPFVILALLLFQNRKKSSYVIAVSFVLVLFVVFRFLLNVRLP